MITSDGYSFDYTIDRDVIIDNNDCEHNWGAIKICKQSNKGFNEVNIFYSLFMYFDNERFRFIDKN